MQKNYEFYYRYAFPGLFEGNPFPTARVKAYVNSAATKKETWTIGVPTPDAPATVYTIRFSKAGIADIDVSASGADAAALTANLLSAIRLSNIFSYAEAKSSGTTITLTARSTNSAFTVTSPTNATTTADLTLTRVTPWAVAGPIPFGRIVVSGAGDPPKTCRLPISNTGNIILGATIGQRFASERDALGPMAKTEYKENTAVDVCDRIGSAEGLWLEAASNIAPGDTVYIDCNTAGLQGSLTKVATNNLLLPAGIKIVEGSTKNGINNSTFSVLADINLP